MAKKKAAKAEEQIEVLYNKALDYKVEIKCKNQKQKDFLKLLKDKKKEICFGIGSAGSGKSYISLAYALSALKDTSNSYKQIIFINPTIEAGAMNIGYIKGTLEDKTQVYKDADQYTIEKILTNSGNNKTRDIIRLLMNEDYFRYELVNFARGKSYDNCLILICESENFSKEEMLLLLTRIGENCKVIVTGDPIQKDRKDLKKCKDGLTYAWEHLNDLDEVGGIEFTNEDIVRNPLITKIINRFE